MGYTRFERARVIGARALQISLGAPPLIDIVSIDPLHLAQTEYDEALLPLTPRRRP